MLVPRLRFKEFEDEWKKERLNKVAEINPPNDALPNKFIYINLESVEKGVLINKNTITRNNAPSRAQRTIKLNDILFQTVRPYQQNNYFVDKIEAIPYIASTGYALIRTNENPYFLYTILHRQQFLNKVLDMCTGTSFPAINSNDLGTIEIKLPKRNEQEKIGSILYLLDQKIELQKRKIETLKIYKIGMIQNLKSNSQNWNEYKIKNLFEITRGQVIPKNDLKNTPDEEYKYPVYSSQTSNYGILGYDKTFDFDGEFLTWTTDGANAGKVFYRNGKFRCTNVCGLLYSSKNSIYINLLTADLLNYETPKYVSYVGNPKLMNHVMADIKIKLPSLEIQNKISHIFLIFNKKLFLEEQKLEKLNTFKKSLLQQMFI